MRHPVSFSIKKRNGAGNEIRTRDPNLGKVVLYQLSYSRLRFKPVYCTGGAFTVKRLGNKCQFNCPLFAVMAMQSGYK